MKKYRYYLLCLLGLGILFYGAFNASTAIGMIAWGVGFITVLIGVLLQIIVAPNFECPDCGAELKKEINKTKFIKHKV